MVGAAERDEHRRVGAGEHALALARDQHGDVGGRAREDRAHVSARHARAEQRPPAVDEHEVDLLAVG